MPVMVDCPRCDQQIECKLEVRTPKPSPEPGMTLEITVNVPDLADRFREHYVAAGHIGPEDKTDDLRRMAAKVNAEQHARKLGFNLDMVEIDESYDGPR